MISPRGLNDERVTEDYTRRPCSISTIPVPNTICDLFLFIIDLFKYDNGDVEYVDIWEYKDLPLLRVL